MKTLLSFLLLFGSWFLSAQETKIETSKEFQENLNKEYGNREESPLMYEDFKAFKGLDFYPISDKYIVEAKFKRTPDEKILKMRTTSDRLKECLKYGEITFKLEGKKFKLSLYQYVEVLELEGYKDYLFLAFTDLSSGKGSYSKGRYIDLRIPKGNKMIIDFNKAYNPYTAYSDNYSCLIVPLENDLKTEILAGVKKFHD